MTTAKIIQQFLRDNPRATDDEIKEFADKYNFPLTFGSGSGNPDEPGYDKFMYTEHDVERMRSQEE